MTAAAKPKQPATVTMDQKVERSDKVNVPAADAGAPSAEALAETIKELKQFIHSEFNALKQELKKLYFVLEGAVGLVIQVPDRDKEQPLSGQLTGKLTTKDITVSTVGTGGVFGWSALIPPHEATAGAKALTPCRAIIRISSRTGQSTLPM